MSNKKTQSSQRDDATYVFHEIGFHGDKYLLSVVDNIVVQGEIDYFVETGTNVGATLSYFAKRFPSVQCYSCEPDHYAYTLAVTNTSGLSNVHIYNLTSQEFLKILIVDAPDIKIRSTLFWVDAHGYGFSWPLKKEVEFISSTLKKSYMLIDDFKVPGSDLFGYDKYGDQVCSYEYIKDSFQVDSYFYYYPLYSEMTSTHHPLRGWGLFVIGGELEIPSELKDKVRSVM